MTVQLLIRVRQKNDVRHLRVIYKFIAADRKNDQGFLITDIPWFMAAIIFGEVGINDVHSLMNFQQ